jgi:DNA repair exonuclease SbcCD nuclease subunit
VTIGGDLFEHEGATLDTGNFLRQQFERLGGIPVLIAPGNHDPYLPGSLYRRIVWSTNVTVFEEPRFVAVEALPGLTVWGAAHNGPAVRENLLDSFRVSGPGRHVLLFHGSDLRAVPEGKLAHCPFNAEDIAASGADFALLGHYHAPRLFPENAPRYGYPGSPEALDFGEEGAHCVLRLEISESGTAPQLMEFGRVSYRTDRISVDGMTSSEELRAAIAGMPAGGMVRVVLVGQVQAEIDLSVTHLYNSCAERFDFLDIIDRTEPGYDFDQLAEESTTKGVFVRLMRERIARLSDGERDVAEEALLLGLRAFDRRELVS